MEICINGTWGKICPNNWSIMESTTVCKQLGFSENGITIATAIDKLHGIDNCMATTHAHVYMQELLHLLSTVDYYLPTSTILPALGMRSSSLTALTGKGPSLAPVAPVLVFAVTTIGLVSVCMWLLLTIIKLDKPFYT